MLPTERIAKSIIPRIIIFGLIGALFTLLAKFHYSFYNSDAAVYGYMGNDIMEHGYWPSMMYGQNFLFSITPYFYAFNKTFLLTTTPDEIAFKISGLVLSFAGLWLVFESFLATQKKRQGALLVPLLFFGLLIIPFPNYVFSLSDMGAVGEVYLFCIGAMLFLLTRMDDDISNMRFNRSWPWFLFAVVWIYSSYSRPQAFVYGFAGIFLLGLKTWAWMDIRKIKTQTTWFALGAFTGYLPLALHKIFREHDSGWPFGGGGPSLKLISRKSFRSLKTIIYDIFPNIFDLGWGHIFFSALVLLLIGAALAMFVLNLRKREEITVADGSLVFGTALLLYVMVTSGLAVDVGSSRYCAHLALVVAWTFSRFCVKGIWRTVAAGALVLALLAFSVPQWKNRLNGEEAWQTVVEKAKSDMVPYLIDQDAVIFAGYWDAYSLGFLSQGKLRIEAFPWNAVRRYGAISEQSALKKSLWLFREDQVGEINEYISNEFGNVEIKSDLPLMVFGRKHRLIELGRNDIAVRAINKYQPLYFKTKYPPGS